MDQAGEIHTKALNKQMFQLFIVNNQEIQYRGLLQNTEALVSFHVGQSLHCTVVGFFTSKHFSVNF